MLSLRGIMRDGNSSDLALVGDAPVRSATGITDWKSSSAAGYCALQGLSVTVADGCIS